MNSELLRFAGMLRETFHVELPTDIGERLQRFQVELLEWNPVVSLVSETTSEADLWQHTLDSLALVPYLIRRSPSAGPHIDVGSGGGFPAIPIALALPALPVVCIERNKRKASFIERT